MRVSECAGETRPTSTRHVARAEAARTRTALARGGWPVAVAGVRTSRGAHDGLDVGEVDIDEAGLDDDVRDAHHALTQNVVGHAEGLLQRRALLDNVEQPVVRNDDHRVDMRLELLDGGVCLAHAARTLKGEGLRHHAHRETPRLLGCLRDDRRRAGAGAATHASHDEDHVRTCDHLCDLLVAFVRGRSARLRAAAGAEAARRAGAEAKPVGRERGINCLDVGINGPEFDSLRRVLSKLDHAVDRVAAATTNTDDLVTRAKARGQPRFRML